MIKFLPVLLIAVFLGGCKTGSGGSMAGMALSTAISLAASQSTSGGGIYASGTGRSGNLPDTPQCRNYLRYARSAGAMGTYGPLVKRYNACLASAKRNPRVKKYRCAPGKYYHWYNGRRVCR